MGYYMPENRRKKVEIRPATITYDKKVAIYCRVSTPSESRSKDSIQRILVNEKYMGNVILGKTYTIGFPNNKQKINRGQYGLFLMEEAHNPIISKETFEQVQEEIKRRSNTEVVNGETKRKGTHYSSKGITGADE